MSTEGANPGISNKFKRNPKGSQKEPPTLVEMIPFVISTLLVIATAVLGSQYTQQSVQSPWYNCVRPTWAPPNWVFPVVWTILYISLAAAMGLSILSDAPLLTGLHVLNLVLNVLWCRTFFAKRETGLGLGIIVGNAATAIAIASATTIPTVRYLMIPYIAWLLFATSLNAAAWKNSVSC